MIAIYTSQEARQTILRRDISSETDVPQAMRDGYSSTPRNGTPSALFEALMAEFKGAR